MILGSKRVCIEELTLVALCGSFMLGLVELVTDGILCSLSAGSDAGVGVFGHVLVGLFGSLSGGTLDLVGDEVGGVLLLQC